MSRSTATVSRREMLRVTVVGGLAAAVAGCTTSSGGQSTPTSPGGPEDPDRALRDQVGAEQRRLVALYANADVPSAVASNVTTLGSRHVAYGQAINPAGQVVPTSADAAPSANASTEPVGLKGLRKAELSSSTMLIEQASKAVDPELARLLVLSAAGSAAAAEALRMMASG